MSDEKLGEYFNPLYKNGFHSLRPIVTESNENFLKNHYAEIAVNYSSINMKAATDETAFDYLDDLEDIIGDDYFAAFLNNNAEIVVGTKIYKYTDVGLFITPEEQYSLLNAFLDEKNISKIIGIKTPDNYKQVILEEYPNNNVITISGGIEYFKMAPIYNDDADYGSGGPSPYVPTPGSVPSGDTSYVNFLNSLTSCQPNSGLFGNLFGENNVCIDKYERRRRVKTKAFNYNYLLVYHLGVKCVHQFRGDVGLWRTEAIDEVRLVVEAAQFQYDLNALNGNLAVNNQTKERYYFMNNKQIAYVPNSMTIPNWGAPSTTYFNLNSLPGIFKDDLSFEFFSTGWDWLDGQIQNGINSNLNASKLNEYFYNALYSTATSQIQNALGAQTLIPHNRTFVAKFPEQGKLIFQKSVLTIGTGIGVRQRTFDWGAEFSFNANDSGNGWKFNGGAGNVIVRPSNFRVKIIGAARHGNSWHGSKFSVGIN